MLVISGLTTEAERTRAMDYGASAASANEEWTQKGIHRCDIDLKSTGSEHWRSYPSFCSMQELLGLVVATLASNETSLRSLTWLGSIP